MPGPGAIREALIAGGVSSPVFGVPPVLDSRMGSLGGGAFGLPDQRISGSAEAQQSVGTAAFPYCPEPS